MSRPGGAQGENQCKYVIRYKKGGVFHYFLNEGVGSTTNPMAAWIYTMQEARMLIGHVDDKSLEYTIVPYDELRDPQRRCSGCGRYPSEEHSRFCPVLVGFENGTWEQLKLRDYTSAERREIPMHTIIAEFFPDAFAALARHAKKGNDKHNGKDSPIEWSRHKSGDHLNCAQRHLTTPDRIDPDTGEIELVAALWRVAAALQLREETRLTQAGIRPLSGVTP